MNIDRNEAIRALAILPIVIEERNRYYKQVLWFTALASPFGSTWRRLKWAFNPHFPLDPDIPSIEFDEDGNVRMKDECIPDHIKANIEHSFSQREFTR